MADETREVKVKVTAEDDSAAGLRKTEENFRRTGEKIKRDSRGIFKRLGDDAGSSITDSLGRTAVNIGNGLAKVGLKSGTQIGQNLASGLQSSSPQVQGAITALAAGAAASAAPLIGAAIAGAVVGGAAGVGIIGGVALAARDARVQAAGKALGENLLSSLSTDASAFIAPVLASIDTIQRRFSQARDQIGQGFATAARFVAPLTDAILDAAGSIGTGLLAALSKAGPVVSAIAAGVRTLGKTIEYVFVQFSAVGKEGALAFQDIFTIIDVTVRVTAQFLAALAKVYGVVRTLGGLLGGVKDETAGVGDAAAGAGGDMLTFIEGLQNTDAAAAGAASSLNTMTGAIYATGSANLGLAEAQIASARAIEEAKSARDGTTAATLAEKEALIGLVKTFETEIAAMAATGASASEVNNQSNNLRNAFIEQAKAMGYSQAGAEALANSYGLIPKVVNTNISTTGAEKARQEAERVRAVAGSIPDQINIAIRVTGSEAARSAIQSALAKQSMMADAGAAYTEHAMAFAAGSTMSGAGRLSGSRERTPSVALTSDVLVQLDGRQIAPVVTTIARTLDKRMTWREKRVRR